MNHLYNEIEPNAAEWLGNLAAAGEIPQGKIDVRPIQEIDPEDLVGVTQFHTFAGIGGWPLALRLAGWPSEREVWTGSCPCQPFSSAGKGGGTADERHLWPNFFDLIRERRPATVFGEQVGSKAGIGWLDGVQADLEGEGYACGAVIVGAHSVGAPHIRQRIYWVAALGGVRGSGDPAGVGQCGGGEDAPRQPSEVPRARHTYLLDGLGENPDGLGRGRGRDGDSPRDDGQVQATGLRAVGGLADGADARRNDEREHERGRTLEAARPEQRCGGVDPNGGLAHPTGAERGEGGDAAGNESRSQPELAGSGPWSDYRIIPCTDGKARRTGARVFPLAHGLPRGVGDGGAWRKGLARSASRARIGMLKGSGNAIVPQLAAEFIRAFMDLEIKK